MKFATNTIQRLRIFKQTVAKTIACASVRSTGSLTAKNRRKVRGQLAFFSTLILAFVCWSAIGFVTVAQEVDPEGLNGLMLRSLIDGGNLSAAVNQIENQWQEEYEGYFRESFASQPQTAEEIAKTLGRVAMQTKKKPALVYIIPRTDQLELLLVTANRPTVSWSLPQAKRELLMPVIQELVSQITNPRKINTTSYLPAAQQLYQWMVAPMEPELQAQKIDTLIFCVGGGLRTLPLAALHDGQRFLIQKYSITRIPAFQLTDTRYKDLKKGRVLAMGASDFTEVQKEPLPAVPVELKAIANQWPSESFLNETFTLVNLQSQRLQQRFDIIHLATHAEFRPGIPKNSYIQFWDTQLRLDQMSELGWNNPAVELLVLSACRTAVGDKQVELGFGGLAVQAGVKSAIASLWYVSDAGTLALMNELYHQLRTAPIKAEALRQAQIALIEGQVRLEKGELVSSKGETPLPPILAGGGTENLSHPYYWAAFTMIGSPW